MVSIIPLCHLFAFMSLTSLLNRGESFRKEFGHLGDVCCLIPETVHIMALTATATKTTRREIVRVLIVAKSPNKVNTIKAIPGTLETFAGLIAELKKNYNR